MDPIKMGKKISALRNQKGWTQKQLAEQLHVTDKAVSKWERGLCYPDLTLLGLLAALLEITVSELLGVEERRSEEVITVVTEISKQEKDRITKSLKSRAWVNIVIGVCLIVSQIYAGYIFSEAGMYGIPQMITVGLMTFPGFIIGNNIFTLTKLKSL
jgi:transcriptional regulator with XRE-family HTH domain